ncbi:transposase family protein [Kouleothrix sp.]|uniref:transposase family protein n=1 Tax=Kouleothrix sp. TaxID=2779161 RepID=UPI00391B768A
MPYKKPNGQPLTHPQKADNRTISQRCALIEHIISAIKHCCILKEDIWLRPDHIRDTVMEICCGLPNLRLRHVPWQSMP